MSNNRVWWFAKGDYRSGPYTASEFKHFVSRGAVQAADLIWKEGHPNWVAAASVKGLFPPRQALPSAVLAGTADDASGDAAGSTPAPALVPEPPRRPSAQPTPRQPPAARPAKSGQRLQAEAVALATQAVQQAAKATAASSQLPSHTPSAFPAGQPPPLAPQPDSPRWFYEERGQCMGPVPEAQLIQRVEAGEFTGSTRLWRKGFAGWMPLEQTELQLHRPPPPSAEDATEVPLLDPRRPWALALAPWLVWGLHVGLAVLQPWLDLSMPPPGLFWLLTWVLSLGLGWWDWRQLQATGRATPACTAWVWLAPVYLVQRARAQRDDLAQLITWVAGCQLVLLA